MSHDCWTALLLNFSDRMGERGLASPAQRGPHPDPMAAWEPLPAGPPKRAPKRRGHSETLLTLGGDISFDPERRAKLPALPGDSLLIQ